jgi:small ligand-binding sensory domain FIST
LQETHAMKSAMRFAAAVSTRPEARAAAAEACDAACSALGTGPHLALAFVTPHHTDQLDALAALLRQRLAPASVLGCTAEAVACGRREIEHGPALALWLAHLPQSRIVTMHLQYEQTAEGGTFVGWPEELAGPWPAGSALLLLGEPFTFPADVLLARLNEDRPGVMVVGGMASGAMAPGQLHLLYDGQRLGSGAVAAWIHGGVDIQAVVSQGCRPIGRPMVITRSQRNVIYELGGRTPLAVLQELFPTLSSRDQQLLQRGLHVGRVIDEYRDTFGPGDFLVRNVLGLDPDSGALALGDYVRNGQTVQFHLRDAQSADEDLHHLLDRNLAGAAPPHGALLFTCNGRGTRLFAEPDHDAAAVQQVVRAHRGDSGGADELPLAGFFAQGEVGPIGAQNFLHGFTASVVLFRPVA